MATRKTPAQIAAANKAALSAAYLLLAKNSGIEVGDTVKVIRTYKDREMGYIGDNEEYYQKGAVGEEFEVTDIEHDGEFELNDGDYYFPFFCLVKVENLKRVRLNEEYVAEVSNDGKSVEVGCQDIPFEAVEKLYNNMKALQSAKPSKK